MDLKRVENGGSGEGGERAIHISIGFVPPLSIENNYIVLKYQCDYVLPLIVKYYIH